MQNSSGVQPVAWNVLVKMDEVESHMGILARTDQAIHEAKMAQTKGTIVAIGPIAWADEKDADGNHVRRAEVGTHVMVTQYQGQHFKGDDGQQYRMVTDKNILGVLA